jgi:hypothetical protein
MALNRVRTQTTRAADKNLNLKLQGRVLPGISIQTVGWMERMSSCIKSPYHKQNPSTFERVLLGVVNA